MVIKIYQKIRILYLNNDGKTDWLNVKFDDTNKVYLSDEKEIEFADVNIKAVLFNDVNIFNQLIMNTKLADSKQTVKPKKVSKVKETIIENVSETKIN